MIRSSRKNRKVPLWVDILMFAGWAAGIYGLVKQDAKDVTPQIVALGLLGFMAVGACSGLATWRRQKFGEVHSLLAPVLFGFGLISGSDRLHSFPWWFVALALVFVCGVVFGVVPAAVALWRRTADERDRAITHATMALALLATMVISFVFAVLHSLKVGPAFSPEWVLYTGAGTWFVSWVALNRSM